MLMCVPVRVQVTNPEQSRMLFERAGSHDKTLALYGGCFHAVFWEPEASRRVFLTDMVSWMQRRVIR